MIINPFETKTTKLPSKWISHHHLQLFHSDFDFHYYFHFARGFIAKRRQINIRSNTYNFVAKQVKNPYGVHKSLWVWYWCSSFYEQSSIITWQHVWEKSHFSTLGWTFLQRNETGAWLTGHRTNGIVWWLKKVE